MGIPVSTYQHWCLMPPALAGKRCKCVSWDFTSEYAWWVGIPVAIRVFAPPLRINNASAFIGYNYTCPGCWLKVYTSLDVRDAELLRVCCREGQYLDFHIQQPFEKQQCDFYSLKQLTSSASLTTNIAQSTQLPNT